MNIDSNPSPMKSSIDAVLKYLEKGEKVKEQDIKVLQFAVSLFFEIQSNNSLITPSVYQRMKEKVEEKTFGVNDFFFYMIKCIILDRSFSVKPLKICAHDLEDKSSNDNWVLLDKKEKIHNKAPLKNENDDENKNPLLTRDEEIQESKITTQLGEFWVCKKNYNPDDDYQAIIDQIIKDKQELIIAQFGHALFEDYLPYAINFLKKSLFDLVFDNYLQSQVRSLIETHIEKQTLSLKTNIESPASHRPTRLLNTTLIIQTQYMIEGLKSILQKILVDPELRLEFPTLLFEALPANLHKNMSVEGKELIKFFITHYLPEILRASLDKFSEILKKPNESEKLIEHLTHFLGKQRKDIDVDMIELVAYLILNHILDPLEAGFEIFIDQIKNENLSAELKKLLNTAFMHLFFTDPGKLEDIHKKLLVESLKSIKDFLTTYEKIKIVHENTRSFSQTPEADFVGWMLPTMLSKGLLPFKQGKEIDLDLNIRNLIEGILWQVLFPGSKKENIEVSLTLKLAITLISAFSQRLCSQLFSGNVLKIAINRFLSHTLETENPFDRNLPPEALLFKNDKEFSSQIDEILKGIIHEVLKLSNSFLLKTFGAKAVNLIPDLGFLIEQKLNKICESTTSVTTILILMQFLYKFDTTFDSSEVKGLGPKEANKLKKTSMQKAFLEGLDSRREPLLLKVLLADTVSNEHLYTSIDRKILIETKELEKLIEASIPLGFRDYFLSCIQTMYKIFREDLVLKVLFIYVLNGIDTALKESFLVRLQVPTF